jgi:hypothetical protein
LALDEEGYVYVTGISNNLETGDAFTTIKYDTGGNEIWVAHYNGEGTLYSSATAIAMDKKGHIYVTGWSSGSGTGTDVTTIKYDTTGNEIWVVHYSGPGNRDAANSIAVDKEGFIYVIGISYVDGTNRDGIIIKYDTNGNLLWVNHYNGSGSSDDNFTDIALDKDENIYVAGDSFGSNSNVDFVTIKYDAGGNQLWAIHYNGPGNGGDSSYSIAVNQEGEVYVTGRSRGADTYYDFATVKYVQVMD